jgi:hypothetical protein
MRTVRSWWSSEAGDLIDPHLGRPLPHSYHYGHIVLAGALLHRRTEEAEPRELAVLALNRFRSLVQTGRSGAHDFNLEPILVAAEKTVDEELRDLCLAVAAETPSPTDAELANVKATDFRLLRRLVTLLRARHGLPAELASARADAESARAAAGADGLLFDTIAQSGAGVPDLVYHCRNLEILLSTRRFAEDEALDDLIEQGVGALVALASPDGDAGYYGRSMGSVYGTAAALLALTLADKLGFGERQAVGDARAALRERLLSVHFDAGRNSFNLTPYANDRGRPAFDTYMYVSVYVSFALSRLALAEDELPEAPTASGSDGAAVTDVRTLGDGCFAILRCGEARAVLNYRGHQDSPLRPRDPRYVPGALLSADDGRASLLPHIPIFLGAASVPGELPPRVARLRARLRARREGAAHQAGHVPVLIDGGYLHVPALGRLLATGPETLEVAYDLRPEATGTLAMFASAIRPRQGAAETITEKIAVGDRRITREFSVPDGARFGYVLRYDTRDTIEVASDSVTVRGKLRLRTDFPFKTTLRRKLEASSGPVSLVTLAATERRPRYVVSLEATR